MTPFPDRGGDRRRLAAVVLLAALAGVPAVGADGGEEAILAPLAARSLLLDVAAGDGWMVAVGERGHVLVSRDDGRTWTQRPAPTRATLTAVTVRGASSAWAVGHDEVVLRTRDGGETWGRVHHAPEEERPLLDVLFLDDERGIAIGAYGLYLETEDGGETWNSREIQDDDGGGDGDGGYDEEFYGGPIDYHLNQLSAEGERILTIAAEAGALYRSQDAGATWRLLPSPYEGSFFGSLPVGEGGLLVFGLRGHLFRTDDGGETWNAIEIPTTAMLTDGIRTRDGAIVLAGLSGTLVVGRDDGYEVRQRGDREGIAAVCETADGALVIVGEGGVERIERP